MYIYAIYSESYFTQIQNKEREAFPFEPEQELSLVDLAFYVENATEKDARAMIAALEAKNTTLY